MDRYVESFEYLPLTLGQSGEEYGYLLPGVAEHRQGLEFCSPLSGSCSYGDLCSTSGDSLCEVWVVLQ